MPDYEKLYHKTFNAITDAERLIAKASILLKAIQIECEETYLDSEDTNAVEGKELEQDGE